MISIEWTKQEESKLSMCSFLNKQGINIVGIYADISMFDGSWNP